MQGPVNGVKGHLLLDGQAPRQRLAPRRLHREDHLPEDASRLAPVGGPEGEGEDIGGRVEGEKAPMQGLNRPVGDEHDVHRATHPPISQHRAQDPLEAGPGPPA